MLRRPCVALVGGGIGGLTAQLALTRAGVEAHLFEQATELKEVGAGIGLSANAMKVLRALGLENALRERGFEPEVSVGRDWTSAKTLFHVPLMKAGSPRFGAPHLNLHRADVLDALATAVPEKHLHLGCRCVGLSSSDQGAVITFSNGSQAEADLVVGCDGIRSFVRDTIHGPDAPRFTGNMCWRALIPTEKLPLNHVPPHVTVWRGPRGHIITYYVRAGQLVNIVAVRETPDWVEESWTVQASRDEISAAYADVHRDLRLLLDQVDDGCFKWGLFDREPLPTWSAQCITLLGDAAHPMLPFLGQGAAMAIEDAFVLARAISCCPDNIATALKTYESTRRPRATKVQLASRRQARIFHGDSSESAFLDADWIYAYDATDQARTRKPGSREWKS
jgi:salicylate hydroxylase